MAWPPDFNGSNGSRGANETNGSKQSGSNRQARDRPYTPVSRPAPSDPKSDSGLPEQPLNPGASASADSGSELNADRVQRARKAAKRFYLILLVIGLVVGALVSVAVVALLNRFGLTDSPDRPLLEQIQPDSSESSGPPGAVVAMAHGAVSSPTIARPS